MATYDPITNAEIDPESPLTTSLFTKLRDNPIALFELYAGTITRYDTVGAHTFTVSLPAEVTQARLVISAVAGGGAGGDNTGVGCGGGGAGGAIVGYEILDVDDGDEVEILIGAGGATNNLADGDPGDPTTLIYKKSSVEQWKMYLGGGGGGSTALGTNGGAGGIVGFLPWDSDTFGGVWVRAITPQTEGIPCGSNGSNGGDGEADENGGYGGDSPFAPGGAGGDESTINTPGLPGSKGSGGGGRADNQTGSQEPGAGGDGFVEITIYPLVANL